MTPKHISLSIHPAQRTLLAGIDGPQHGGRVLLAVVHKVCAGTRGLGGQKLPNHTADVAVAMAGENGVQVMRRLRSFYMYVCNVYIRVCVRRILYDGSATKKGVGKLWQNRKDVYTKSPSNATKSS